MFAGYERRLTVIVLFQSPIAGDQNLNHRRGNPGGELLDRGIKLLQHRWRFRRPGSDLLGFVKIRLRQSITGSDCGRHRRGLPKARHCKPQGAQACDQTKKRDAELAFPPASWEEHSDTLLRTYLYRVMTQIMIAPEWNKSEFFY